MAITLATPVSLLAFACGDDDGASPSPVSDATSETPFIGETSPPPDLDAEPPPGDVCGPRSGLSPSAPWPLRGGCSTRAGRAYMAGPHTATISSNVPLPIGDSSPAVTANGLAWVGTSDGWVMAISNVGAVRWAHRTGGVVTSSPAIDAEGRAVVAGGDGILYGLIAVDQDLDAGTDAEADAEADAGQGYPPAKVSFALPIGPMSTSPAIAGDGTIYVGSGNELVSVAKDGSKTNWRAATNDTAGSSPAIGQDGTVYIGSSDRKLYAFQPSGAPRWAVDLGAPIEASPSVGGDGTVYIGTSDGKLHALRSDGTERWSYATGGPIKGSAAVYAGVVYVGSEDKKLHAVSTVDGKARWTYSTLGAVATPVIGGDGTVYFGAADARLYAVTDKGSLFFAVNVKAPVTSAPAIGLGTTLYVSTQTSLTAISP